VLASVKKTMEETILRVGEDGIDGGNVAVMAVVGMVAL
jgi:hypothetical protein